MIVLVLNCGSSSIKFQVVQVEPYIVLAKGLLERIGLNNGKFHYETDKKISFDCSIKDHDEGLGVIIDKIVSKEHGVLNSLSDITVAGHRVVHGGEEFSGSVLVDDKVMKTLEKCIPLAPLHNPANIMGIKACMKRLPGIPQVGVFDTAFHQSMPDYAYMYALPYELYDKYRIRRYGFHGTSHRYVSKRASELLNLNYEELKIITCHLGNGSSIAAICGGKSVDTSMGFTPLEGLYMGTRCGDIDAAIIKFLVDNAGMSVSDIDTLLNKKSGLLGISGISSDMRDIEQKAWNEDHYRAKLALSMFQHKVKKYIGSYAALMNGLDILIFTGGVGENGYEMREMICSNMEYLGIKLDISKNKVRGKETEVSTNDSRVKVLVVPTNEELVIASDAVEVIATR